MDKPYSSPQLIFAPKTAVIRTYDNFHMDFSGACKINELDVIDREGLAENDGFGDQQDFLDWFMLSPGYKRVNFFNGQMICFTDLIRYKREN